MKRGQSDNSVHVLHMRYNSDKTQICFKRAAPDHTRFRGRAIIMNDTLSQVSQLPEPNSGIAMDAAKVNILILLDARDS